MPDTPNPFVLIAWIIGTPAALTFCVLAVKGIVFIADASKDLKTVVQYVHDRRTIDSITEITLTLMENDITTMQEHANLPTHAWPDRRSGNDRRAS